MLSLTRKLCPLFSLIFMVGCGKKMTEPETVTKPHIEPQVPSPTLIIPIETRSYTMTLERSGGFKFPDRLRVRSNNAVGKVVTIVYNIPSEDPASFDYKCTYVGTGAATMPVDSCVDMEGDDLGDITDGRENPLDAGKSVRFESNSDEFEGDAIYDVDWY